MKFPHNMSRVEAFSDAVFAFAATLMVVSFDMNESILLITSQTTNFITFGISFFVLVALWGVHYNYFRRTNYIDNWIITFNAILLFVILYFVFPLKSLINSWLGKEQITLEGLGSLFELYSIGFVLIFLFITLMYYRAYKKTKKLENSITLYFYTRHFGIFVIVALASVVIAYFQLGIQFALPGLIYFLLGPLCYLHGVQFNKKYETT